MTTPQVNLFAPEQFRISRLQVFNWGTFSNLHDIPISEKGFLFVGRSGSGKSTLLDAFSALLIPSKWIDFNAAAREVDRGSRDRNFVSYIRGAWAEQKDNASGEIGTQYLRTGTTWSALALTYRNPRGKTVVLVQLFWLRGNTNNNADVKRHFLIFERPFDLQELPNFDLNVRALKQTFPQMHAYDEYKPYCERFMRMLGIETDVALRLLHKTQSAKNLGDLNSFLRDFMLDKPPTFDVADRLVAEFSELSTAHQAVVTARKQVQMLSPAKEEHQQLLVQQAECHSLEELRLGIDQYYALQYQNLLNKRITELQIEINGLVSAHNQVESLLSNHILTLRDLEHQQMEMGGGRIVQLEDEGSRLDKLLSERTRKCHQAQEACRQLGWLLPDTPQLFAELAGKARSELADAQAHHQTIRTEQFNLVGKKKVLEENFTGLVTEIKTLKSQPSNIPANMIELRTAITTALSLHESALPFVGELIEVRAEEVAWQGAIERVLHGFALSLLVDEKHYTVLSNYINQNNLGRRLVYFRVGEIEQHMTRSIAANSLIHKLRIKECNNHAWLAAELIHRFDFVCVDSLQAFRSANKALTVEGQVKHGKTMHEKNDRHRVNDKTHWVLGFDNREKLALFEQQAHGVAEQISQLDKTINALSDHDRQHAARQLQCQLLANIEWQEIDVAPVLNRLSTIKQLLSDLRTGNTVLQELEQRLKQQKKLVEDAETHLRDIKVKQQSKSEEMDRHILSLHDLQKNESAMTLTPQQEYGLSARFNECGKILTLGNLKEIALQVERRVGQEIEVLGREINKLEKAIENRFAEFKRQWPAEASDMDTTLASASDFFAKLNRLETDGLPMHEQRFFDLLQNQSRQNLAALSTHLSQARKAIIERMELVNESLSKAEFNPGTYLFIDVTDKQLAEVREFRQQIQQALSDAWSDNKEQAEVRFRILSQLVQRLSSQEPAERRWREAVLDVRQHVEFIGRERDTENCEVEIYRSGAGKSGGQRQKLATTCLAAALRYQLGGNDHYPPIYAPVILDEAFDKADNEFTELAMNIFANFGFQMIVATPLKSVMTLERFIGGACFVDIADRKHSSVLSLAYDIDKQSLNLESDYVAATS